MKKITHIKKNYFNYFLVFYSLIGIYLSLSVGITHDEAHSNWVWKLNFYKILNIFLDSNYDVSYLNTYHGYYGVGFYYLAAPLDLIFSKMIDMNEISLEGSVLLAKHPAVFIFFIISGIYLRKIFLLLTQDALFSNLSTILFLTYPYIFGHSLFNIKDIPFMSIWVICTYYLMNIFINS